MPNSNDNKDAVVVPITTANPMDKQAGANVVGDMTSKKPVSARKREANRLRAKKSTGPKTARGKANTRWNAMKHGFFASVVLLFENDEERTLFGQLLSGLWQAWRPVGPEENACLEEIAICRWRKRRGLLWEFRQQREASRFEWAARETENPSSDWSPESSQASAAAGEPPEILIGSEMPALHDLSLILRYDAAADRQEHRAIAHLQKLQREREEKSTAASISTKEELNQ